MEVKELGHLVLYVRDLERSVAFYRDLAGMEVWSRRQMQGEWFDTLTHNHGAVIDVAMPGMSGIQYARKLRGDERTRDLPIILMTGYPSVASAIKSIELPVVAYLVKPFDFATLVEKVRAATRRIELLRTMRDEVSRLADCRQTLEQADQHLRDQPR